MHWTIYPQKATKQLLGTIFFKMASDSKFPTWGTLLKDLMFWGSAQHSLDENQDSFIRCLMLDNKSPSKNIDPDFWNTGEIHKQLLGPASTKKKKKKLWTKEVAAFHRLVSECSQCRLLGLQGIATTSCRPDVFLVCTTAGTEPVTLFLAGGWESVFMVEMQPKTKAGPYHCCAP